MTVQELINELTKFEDKSKRVILAPDDDDFEYNIQMQEWNDDIVLY